jgi:hypothetical protein
LPPHLLEQVIAYNIRNRYEEIIREINKEYYNEYKDVLAYNADAPNIFGLKYIPIQGNLRLFVNGVWYSTHCFELDRINKRLTWTFTKIHGGFDLQSNFDFVAIYDIALADNPGLNSLDDIV